MSRAEKVLAGFVRKMAIACDRTKAHRTVGVIVDTIDWHGLMALAEMAKAALALSTDLQTGEATFNGKGDSLKVSET